MSRAFSNVFAISGIAVLFLAIIAAHEGDYTTAGLILMFAPALFALSFKLD